MDVIAPSLYGGRTHKESGKEKSSDEREAVVEVREEVVEPGDGETFDGVAPEDGGPAASGVAEGDLPPLDGADRPGP